MMIDAREKVLELVEEGMIDKDYLIGAFVRWLTSDEIEEMAHANEIALGLGNDNFVDESGGYERLDNFDPAGH